MAKAKSIDIRKVSLPDCEYYESVKDNFAVTFIGRLKGITQFGHEALLEREPFCRLLRTLVKILQRGDLPNKKALCATFGLPGRVYNTANKATEGVIASAIECQKVDLEDVEQEINRQVVEAFWGPSGELPGRLRKLHRLYRKRNRLLRQRGRPHIHFGKKLYQHQEEKGWKKAYERARNDRIGCLGSSDETGGNSTYQIKAVSIEGKPSFALCHARKRMGGNFDLKPRQREELEALLVINHQPFEFTEEICKQGPRKGKKVLRKVTTGRVPLSVWLIRHDNGHWYAHISFIKNKRQPDYAPVGAIGVDLNCDSIADTRFRWPTANHWFWNSTSGCLIRVGAERRRKPAFTSRLTRSCHGAKTHRWLVVLEYLDFEHCKRWLRTKLGAMLRVMPYRKIRKAFERRCLAHGVVLRYVKSNYTSILGAVLTAYPNLGRDQAAAAVIGLRAMEEGNAWLEQQCQALAARRTSGCGSTGRANLAAR